MNVLPDLPEPIAPRTTILHSAGSCSGTMLHVLAFPNMIDILSSTAMMHWKKPRVVLKVTAYMLSQLLVNFSWMLSLKASETLLWKNSCISLCFSSG